MNVISVIEIGTVDECSMIKFPDTEKNGNLPSWTSNRHTSIEVNCSESNPLIKTYHYKAFASYFIIILIIIMLDGSF